ncbi:stage II sporulation protein D [Fictibacillus barbaricus]|uniref:Stage II sporulation protein D n=2 Tax=Fictibacillus barbaricus TaxID=182136 RepID=A0ABU1U203_9BACL|nr:stage II sporulation protein D [Fictibacillus barbaricus]MDR7073492.1 stage II sporulation protein D [Fictibacillus barbaricus]
MNMKIKPLLWIIAIFIAVIVLIPAILVLPFSSAPPDWKKESRAKPTEKMLALEIPHSDIVVPVFRSSMDTVENIPLEEYVTGVVASEMPAEFEVEALKAQALTARTYIVKTMYAQSKDDSLPVEAVVSDTVQHQVYKGNEELKKIWGDEYADKLSKVVKAVTETKGQILTYEGQPIQASFFSMSNGFTVDSEDYWKNKYPYLRSVESPWDKKAPKFEQTVQLPVSLVEEKLGVSLSKDGKIGKVVSSTSGKRIGKFAIGKKEFTGKEIREKLELRSTDFQITKKGKQVTITTKGYGHGVGMSQYGANGMAKEGKTYKDILNYYYKGIAIADYKPLIDKGVAYQK